MKDHGIFVLVHSAPIMEEADYLQFLFTKSVAAVGSSNLCDVPSGMVILIVSVEEATFHVCVGTEDALHCAERRSLLGHRGRIIGKYRDPLAFVEKGRGFSRPL